MSPNTVGYLKIVRWDRRTFFQADSTSALYYADDLKKVVDPVIYRNAFMAHPENLLLSMLADERWHIRELAVRRIIKKRGSSSTVERRRFVVPKLNLKANQFIDMIDFLSVMLLSHKLQLIIQ
ncbi:hypothetical protein AVEN_30647-1 [Araneus ventricosus]|uniref:Uncharacterized protein n=1 Tax=Araneus ventricosus TaxID=182803 RepID=A0A4Y2QC00_ARAVE|nr:hypothetical protein AVEN_30647-1 [Araneus ventricosus]